MTSAAVGFLVFLSTGSARSTFSIEFMVVPPITVDWNDRLPLACRAAARLSATQLTLFVSADYLSVERQARYSRFAAGSAAGEPEQFIADQGRRESTRLSGQPRQ